MAPSPSSAQAQAQAAADADPNFVERMHMLLKAGCIHPGGAGAADSPVDPIDSSSRHTSPALQEASPTRADPAVVYAEVVDSTSQMEYSSLASPRASLSGPLHPPALEQPPSYHMLALTSPMLQTIPEDVEVMPRADSEVSGSSFASVPMAYRPMHPRLPEIDDEGVSDGGSAYHETSSIASSAEDAELARHAQGMPRAPSGGFYSPTASSGGSTPNAQISPGQKVLPGAKAGYFPGRTGSEGTHSPFMIRSSPSSSPFSSRASSSGIATPSHPEEYLHKGEEYTEPLSLAAQQRTVLPLRLPPIVHFRLMALLSLLTVFFGLLYLTWKTFTVLVDVPGTGPAGVALWGTEVLLFGCTLVLVLELSKPPRERPVVALPPKGPFSPVAIFVCCCREPLDVIQDTVAAALRQHYPAERYSVWVLDDGGDDALEQWVRTEAIETYGTHRLRYVRREKTKGVPHHFKAGNINHGLRCIELEDVEFVAILDADMVLHPLFLTRMLPHFTADDVAFVQCPQSFYNLVRGDPLNDSSQDFYDILLPYRDGRDSAQCIGTGMMMRVAALRANGGFSVGSITEDSDTSLSLHAKGYKSAYVHQRLQAGLAAWTLEGYVKQRQRWATGNLQILFHRHPLLYPSTRLGVYRRIIYWFCGAQYYMNFVTLVTLVLPLCILFFDLPIIPQGLSLKLSGLPFVPDGYTMTTARLYCFLLAPFVLSSRLLSMGLYSRLPDAMRAQLRGDQSWFWMTPFNIQAILKFMFPLLSKKFEATGAGRVQSSGLLSAVLRFRIVFFHIAFCVLGLFVVIWSLARTDYHNCGQVLKVSAWSTYILFTVQSMFVPVLHLLMSRRHPQPLQRRELMQYDESGVPFLGLEDILPQRDWRLWLYAIVPTVWTAIMAFSFYAAVTNYNPKFCTHGGFFEYQRF